MFLLSRLFRLNREGFIVTLSRQDKKIASLLREQCASKKRIGAYLARWLGWVSIVCSSTITQQAWGLDVAFVPNNDKSVGTTTYISTETNVETRLSLELINHDKVPTVTFYNDNMTIVVDEKDNRILVGAFNFVEASERVNVEAGRIFPYEIAATITAATLLSAEKLIGCFLQLQNNLFTLGENKLLNRWDDSHLYYGHNYRLCKNVPELLNKYIFVNSPDSDKLYAIYISYDEKTDTARIEGPSDAHPPSNCLLHYTPSAETGCSLDRNVIARKNYDIYIEQVSFEVSGRTEVASATLTAVEREGYESSWKFKSLDKPNSNNYQDKVAYCNDGSLVFSGVSLPDAPLILFDAKLLPIPNEDLAWYKSKNSDHSTTDTDVNSCPKSSEQADCELKGGKWLAEDFFCLLPK